MKRFIIAGAALCLAAVAACAPITAAPGGTLVPAATVAATVNTAQVVIAAGSTAIDTAYNTVARLYIAALPSIPPDVKARLKPLFAQALVDVRKADAAADIGDSATLAAQIQAATTHINQARALLPAPKS